jgi:hypothetical protein
VGWSGGDHLTVLITLWRAGQRQRAIQSNPNDLQLRGLLSLDPPCEFVTGFRVLAWKAGLGPVEGRGFLAAISDSCWPPERISAP